MKAQPAQLPQLLKKGLAPVYLVSGDEPLLVQECCDQIRQAARKAGYGDRVTYHADQQLDWNTVGEEFGALSLFAEKRRIEIHLPNGKLGDGRKILEQVLPEPPDDIILILISARLDAAELRRKWYKLLQDKGVHVTVWPVDNDKFIGWLQQRARNQNLHLTRGALDMLAERLEGNLLAAAQELERLALFANGETIDEDTVEKAVQDSARFNVFELVTELLQGNAQSAQRIIGFIQHEGENPLGLLSILSRDLNLVLELQQAVRQRETPGSFLKQRGIRQPQRARALETAARRLSRPTIYQALALCSDVDRTAKGYGKLPPWHHLRDLASLMAK
ncbi:DNA polymerase III subunit delta [Marinobacter xestospongiae]|uniref:DNA polymerase III subunit delta n=1 Tax=Marinobacter xestospongiae TaxID=994319 RepID=A0ABU3VS75_9GAMM|nr:DNA polymerase III subunit delta [Marinobacter xestospongiae]MDV2077112.1 DNA polymerase III subunit delta [Marinobacter xestospongiae]